MIEEILEQRLDADDTWRLFLAALQLIEEKPKPSTAEKVMRWLEPEGAFERLDVEPCPEDMRLRIRVLLRQWRSSDRFLFPALDAVERLGLAEEAQAVLDAPPEEHRQAVQSVGEQAEDFDVPVMTRATWTSSRPSSTARARAAHASRRRSRRHASSAT